MRHVSDQQRRARLAVRHALAPAHRAGTPEAATRAMTVLHATEPATVHLACRARVADLHPADVDRALYQDRILVKQLAMRRTLFVFPRDLLPAVWPSASARVAATERARLAKDVVQSGLASAGGDWVDQARAAVLDALAGAADGRPAADIRRAVPMIDVTLAVTNADPKAATRVLTYLSAAADVVRGVNAGGWHVSRPRWTPMSQWLPDAQSWWTAADGYRELVRRWLYTFGPGTEDDLVWWFGATKGIVRSALAALDAVAVSLDGGGTGWLLPDDLDDVADPGPWAALLPVLDPTVMGWQQRDFYLGGPAAPHRDLLFDRRGNAGTTAWVDGRVVGCWVQDPAGVVEVRLLEDVPAAARRALDAEAARLTEWCAGFRVPSVYRSPAMQGH
ncbi:winged helix DNA-binding domain-containing protein [Dactylosporangium sp. NPDC050688]|uniref:winged helix DNA-binding domain-containing protein n=1 Tax=Dactylosporangium sp. NPDC050688 TaxID=3157217 RepID=UPI003411E6F7